MIQIPCYIGGIDTVEVSSTSFVTGKYDYLSFDSSRQTIISGDITRFKYRINPDKKVERDIHSFSEYITVINDIFEELELEDILICRVDFRFDDYNNEYSDLFKLNQLLFYLLSIKQFKIKDYCSFGIKSPISKTLRIHNSHIEAEFYNKKIQEPNSKIKSRLELRTKGMNHSIWFEIGESKKRIEEIELDRWIDRLDKVANLKKEDYDNAFEKLNNEIIKCYNADIERKEYRKGDYNSMIQRYNKYIFTRRQLVDLFKRLNYNSPESMASKYKKSHVGIEFFSNYEVKKYIKLIRFVAKTFIDS